MPMFSKKTVDYFKKHPEFNGAVHALGGIGVGVLIARPFINHPVQMGALLLLLSVLGHLYPVWIKK
jgi:hypothetical protein